MPKNLYRLDLRLPPDLSDYISRLCGELSDKSGSRVTKTEVVLDILQEFKKRNPIDSCNLQDT